MGPQKTAPLSRTASSHAFGICFRCWDGGIPARRTQGLTACLLCPASGIPSPVQVAELPGTLDDVIFQHPIAHDQIPGGAPIAAAYHFEGAVRKGLLLLCEIAAGRIDQEQCQRVLRHGCAVEGLPPGLYVLPGGQEAI